MVTPQCPPLSRKHYNYVMIVFLYLAFTSQLQPFRLTEGRAISLQYLDSFDLASSLLQVQVGELVREAERGRGINSKSRQNQQQQVHSLLPFCTGVTD